MGRYQAQRDGEPAELAQAMDEFYMPVFQATAASRPGQVSRSRWRRSWTLVGILVSA